MELLHVGCGPKGSLPDRFKDYKETRLDIDKSLKPDIVADITDMSIIEDESFEAVYSSHNLEHLFFDNVFKALNEFKRVLKKGGRVFISVPNIKEAAKYIATDKLEEPLYLSASGNISALDMIYGHIESVRNGNEYMMHKMAFTPRSLYEKLKAVGFDEIKITENLFNIEASGVKND